MRSRRYVTGLLAVGLTAALGVGATAAVTAQDGGEDSLVARLAELDEQIGALPPEDVTIDPAQTWGTFVGDFVGAKLRFDAVEGELRELWVNAADAGDEDGEAVARATNALLRMHDAYRYLAEFESHDLAFPLDTFDEDGVATGADELRGDAEAGLRILSDAMQEALPAYQALRDSEAAGDARSRLEQRAAELENARAVIVPLIHEAASFQDTQVMATVQRFQTTAPGVEARARAFVVTCIDRDAYEQTAFANLTPETLAAPQGVAALVEASAELGALLIEEDVTTVDCPDVDEVHEQRVTELTVEDLFPVADEDTPEDAGEGAGEPTEAPTTSS